MGRGGRTNWGRGAGTSAAALRTGGNEKGSQRGPRVWSLENLGCGGAGKGKYQE